MLGRPVLYVSTKLRFVLFIYTSQYVNKEKIMVNNPVVVKRGNVSRAGSEVNAVQCLRNCVSRSDKQCTGHARGLASDRPLFASTPHYACVRKLPMPTFLA